MINTRPCPGPCLALRPWLPPRPCTPRGCVRAPQLGAGRPAAPDTGPPRAADYIVAVVNSEPITNNEVRSRMVRFEQQLAQQGTPLPPRANWPGWCWSG